MNYIIRVGIAEFKIFILRRHVFGFMVANNNPNEIANLIWSFQSTAKRENPLCCNTVVEI